MEINNKVEKDTLELVLEEFTEEQKLHTKSVGDLVTAINSLTNRVSQFEEKLETPKTVAVNIDTKPIQEIVKKGITAITLVVDAQPKSIIHKRQILLFPEQDAKLFYKIVFGRWIFWLVIGLFIKCLLQFGFHWSDNQKEIKFQQLENDRISKAWNYLYYQQGKKVRQLMDSAYSHSE
ncbi:MAG: hypothetical protein K2X37_07660 [Chitinophagaceae bacterium]|nr:hypothetical protein [Chitinophagaceae bacterium]